MTPYSILPLVSSIVGVVLGGVVLLKDPRRRANILFFILCTFISTWYLSVAVMLSAKDEKTFKLFSKIGLFPINLIIIPYSLFYMGMFKIQKKWLIISLAAVSLICQYVLLDNKLTFTYFFSGKYIYRWGPYPKAGIFETLGWITILIGLAVSIISCAKKTIELKRQLPAIEYTRLKYMFIASLIFAACSVDYLPKFGVNIYPLGCVFFLCFASIITYAILKHNILDIRIVIRKGIIYSLLITIITALYFAMVVALEYIFRGFAGYKSIPLTFVIITLFIIILQPLKNKIQHIVDKYFFKGSIEQIEQENIKLRNELQRSEKLKVVGTLAAGMAHEIKNPLTSIKTFTEYLSEKHQDKDFIDKFQRIVGLEVEKINNIVGQLLDFAKPKPLELKSCNINLLIDETLDLLSNHFIKNKIEVSRNYKALNPIIKVDPVQIRQVILNVLLNSIEAMKENGGRITIATFCDNSENFIFEIADSGKGIEKKYIRHIFDPFFSTKDTNTGLGLSIVHGIIEKHHGWTNVKSELGRGTTFVFTIPIKIQ